MILSRTLAKRRIAAGVRPGWGAAWGPVGFDAACLVIAFFVLVAPFQALVNTMDAPVWAIVAALLLLGFVPVQTVLIFSSLWAAKSRWIDMDMTE